jgi:hypothetical protein
VGGGVGGGIGGGMGGGIAGGTGGGIGGGTGGGVGGGTGGMMGGTSPGLGQTCTQMMACPNGSDCLAASEMATTGFCSAPCTGGAMSTMCNYSGPGGSQGLCIITMMMGGTMGDHCGILCLAAMNPNCPMGMSCQNQQMVMGMMVGICLPG